MCEEHTGKPLKIGAIIISSHTKCVACDSFEKCTLPPAILARIALELSARRAVEEDLNRQARMN